MWEGVKLRVAGGLPEAEANRTAELTSHPEMGYATGELKVRATDHSEDDGRSVEWVGYPAVGAQSLKKRRVCYPTSTRRRDVYRYWTDVTPNSEMLKTSKGMREITRPEPPSVILARSVDLCDHDCIRGQETEKAAGVGGLCDSAGELPYDMMRGPVATTAPLAWKSRVSDATLYLPSRNWKSEVTRDP